MKCPHCNKRYAIYIRIGKEQAVCRACGYIGEKEKFEEKKEEK